jgi:selenocysteine lyase/cysteine desulfurase
MEKARGITISQLIIAPDGSVDISQLDGMITDKTKLVCLLHASNVLGNILPVEEITDIAHLHNVPVLVDAAQTAGVLPISLTKSGIDLFAFTGHKGLLGPMGTAGLVIRKGLELDTLKEGGTGSSSNMEYQPRALPDKYEVGTHNIVGLAGLLAAVEFIEKIGVKTIYDKEKMMLEKLIEVLDDIPEIEIYGSKSAENCVGLLTFNAWKRTKESIRSPEGISSKLDDRFDIMTRAGVHCSSLAHRVIGTEKHGAIRASFGYFNEVDDVLALADALEQLVI